ncbi:phospholipase D family protein [Microbulbifer sp. SAOS-129_SWC]|uniref:phospholipase D-like domain-containing protein n=1 Tax=Microbulbifer sp. SAOS-129_SWC TaxID=3145235 RepID=UPI003217B4E7
MRQIPLLLVALVPALFLLGGCAGRAEFAPPPPRTPSYHLAAPSTAALPRITRRLTAGHDGLTGVYPVTSARNALATRLAAIRAARGSIDIQYFIFRRDDTGLLLTRELVRAAARGVRVRFLLDDFTTGNADKVLLALDRLPNIEVRLFNPFPHRGPRALEFFADFPRLQRRMHNKSLTVDDSVSFIGGRNLSNKYFGIDHEINFGDLDLITIGAAVADIGRQFDEYWNSSYAFPVRAAIPRRLHADAWQLLKRELDGNAAELLDSDYGRSLEPSPVIRALSDNPQLWYWAPAQVLYDPPHKVAIAPQRNRQFAGRTLMQHILSAQRQIVVISPYFLPGEHYLQLLLAAARRGVQVYILTNSLASTDVTLVHGAYRKYRRPLLAAGVHLYELSSRLKYKLDNWNGDSRSLLHAKAFVIDGRELYVGSFNLDRRSILLNTELGLLIESPRLAGEIADNFIHNVGGNAYRLQLQRGELVWLDPRGPPYRQEPNARWWQRLGSQVSSWLPLEPLL